MRKKRRKKKKKKKRRRRESKAFTCFARSNANASTAFDSSFLMLLSIQELRVHKIREQELVVILQTAPRL
jgi:transcription elongation factor Elf1